MNAAIYARKSTEQNGVADESKSVARQVEHARAYATRKDWTVAEECVYVDDGISGAEFSNRPGFVRLMNSLRPRAPFEVLIVSELSRLGREQLETGYAVKQLSQAGVRIFSYLEDREILLDTPTDKFLMSAANFAAEIEREKARQRTYDAMVRKARAGQATGGHVFGYRNVRTPGGVVRVIAEDEAAVVRRIFELAGQGFGFTNIAKLLNADHAVTPRPQQGRPAGWAPSSVREVLYRSTYRGVITWNKTRKRDRWGQKRRSDRPATEWIRQELPELRIVAEDLWYAAHVVLTKHREQYARAIAGRPFGACTKYLLSGLLQCGVCGGGMEARSRAHGPQGRRQAERVVFYGCAAYHRRGAIVCANRQTVPQVAADETILTAVKTTLLNPGVLLTAVDRLADELAGEHPAMTSSLTRELTQVESELARLTLAVAGGGELASLVRAIREREARSAELQATLATLARAQQWTADRAVIVEELTARLTDWRALLEEQSGRANRLLRQVLVGKLRMTPGDDGYHFRGTGTVQPVVAGLVPHNLASLRGPNPFYLVGSVVRTAA
jgi:DNA invertase Pin-like site-specific DNA recombinase